MAIDLARVVATWATRMLRIRMVRTGRVELPFPFGSQILSLVRLPIPPRSLGGRANSPRIATRVRLGHGGSVRGRRDRNGNGPQQARRGIAAGAGTVLPLEALATGDDVQSGVRIALGREERISRTEILLENGHAESLPEELAIFGRQSAATIIGERDDGMTGFNA